MTPLYLGGVFVCACERLAALTHRSAECEANSRSSADTDLHGGCESPVRFTLDVDHCRQIRSRHRALFIRDADAAAQREPEGRLTKRVEHEAHDDIGSAGQRRLAIPPLRSDAADRGDARVDAHRHDVANSGLDRRAVSVDAVESILGVWRRY